MSEALRDKFYGCILGSHIGSSMGAVVEGWLSDRIEATYGTLDHLVAYEHYDNGWLREAGTTEDGIDRQKLMITAIIEKGDRINAEDLRQVWVRDINPLAPGGISEPYEGELMKISKTTIPARDIGRYCDYANLVTMARACHPLGMINAGDVRGAIDDVMEVGQIYHYANTTALKWACVTAVGIAAAMENNATVDSVLQAIFDNLDERKHVEGRDDGWYGDYAGVNLVDELKRALDKTTHCTDHYELREVMNTMYYGGGMPYAMAFANEIVTKAVCIFRMCGGDLKKSIIASVNMGRDTDCLAAVAAGLTGALSGSASVPEEWIRQVDYATTQHRFTNNKRTMRECADGLYGAFENRLRKMRDFVQLMDIE